MAALQAQLKPVEARPVGGTNRYQWLLFDADGTLFDYDRAEASALSQAFESIGVPFKSEYLPAYREINHALWEELERGQTTPAELTVRRFEHLLRDVGVAHPPAEFSERYLDCLADCSELIEGAQEMMHAIQGRCRVAVVTNGLSVVQRKRLAASTIRHCVSALIISEEIGWAKPAREFFDAVFAQIGQPAKAEVLMVGDGWGSDIQGAAQYGLDTCWFNPRRIPRPEGLRINYEISSLGELLHIVNQRPTEL